MVGRNRLLIIFSKKQQVNSNSDNQYPYLCLPVSGSYTLLTWACCFSYSSFVMGTMDLLKGRRDTAISGQYIHSLGDMSRIER